MADSFRLFERAAAALTDSDGIDWPALRARVRRTSERELLDNLRVIAAVRQRCSSAVRSRVRAPIAAAIVTACGIAVTASYLPAVLSAWVHGGADSLRLGQLLLAIAFLAPALWLMPTGRCDARGLSLVGVFTCAAACFARSAAADLAGASDDPFAGVYIEAFLPACAWQFSLDFPDVLRFAPFDRVARRVTALAWAVGAALFAVNVAAARSLLDSARAAVLLHDDPRYWFWHIMSLTLAPALAAILFRARRAPAAERRKVVRLASAIAVGLSPFLALALARIVAPSVDAWFRADATPGRTAVYTIVLAALAATPMLSAAAILVDRPFGIRSGVMASRQTRGPRPLAITRRLAVLARERVSLAAAVELIARARESEKMLILADQLRTAVDATNVHVLVTTDFGWYADAARPSTRLPVGSALVALLRQAVEPIDVSATSALSRLLPTDERTWLAGNNAAVADGIHRPDGELAGVVLLGGRTGGERYDARTREIIAALTAVAGATWPDVRSGSADAHPHELEAALECSACGRVAGNLTPGCPCGAPVVLAPLPANLGATFTVERRIGGGGCGTVYLGRDRRLDRPVALKTLAPVRRRERDRIVREARAMAALNHECLATVYGLELWRETPVVVMEYLANGTLAERLVVGRLSANEAIALGIRLARALAYMHERGVLHCDLKPSNVGFNDAGEAKVLDFGLATLVRAVDEDGDAEPSRRGGTPAYLPRGAMGRPAEAGDDLWAVGVLLLESLTGVNPFRPAHGFASRPRRQAHRLRAALRDSNIPQLLQPFFARAFASCPGDRFQSARALLDALRDLAASGRE